MGEELSDIDSFQPIPGLVNSECTRLAEPFGLVVDVVIDSSDNARNFLKAFWRKAAPKVEPGVEVDYIDDDIDTLFENFDSFGGPGQLMYGFQRTLLDTKTIEDHDKQ